MQKEKRKFNRIKLKFGEKGANGENEEEKNANNKNFLYIEK